MSTVSTDSESPRCVSCGERQNEVVVQDRKTQVWKVVRCDRCEQSYTSPRPTAQSIGRYYDDDYPPHQLKERQATPTYTDQLVLRQFYGYPPGKLNILERTLARLARRLTPKRKTLTWIPHRTGGRLLDFGCGAGQFLARMKRLGWHVSGIDMSPSVANRVREQLGVTVFVGSLPHRDIRRNSYDVVTMWNSLEHVHDPHHVLLAAFQALKPGGELIVGVPNIQSWAAEKFGPNWFGLDLPRHLSHFDPCSLVHLLLQCGFEVDNVEHVPRSGWIRHSARIANDWFNSWKPVAQFRAWRSGVNKQSDFIIAFAHRPESRG